MRRSKEVLEMSGAHTAGNLDAVCSLLAAHPELEKMEPIRGGTEDAAPPGSRRWHVHIPRKGPWLRVERRGLQWRLPVALISKPAR